MKIIEVRPEFVTMSEVPGLEGFIGGNVDVVVEVCCGFLWLKRRREVWKATYTDTRGNLWKFYNKKGHDYQLTHIIHKNAARLCSGQTVSVEDKQEPS